MGDFSYAFSKNRNAAGGGRSHAFSNRKAESFVGNGLDKWKTGAVTTLSFTFDGASELTAAFGNWDVSKVTNMQGAFHNAGKFVGGGLDQWRTGSVTTLASTFEKAVSMNADLGTWDVSKVSNMQQMFRHAANFAGAGLDKWSTTSLTTLSSTFTGAGLTHVVLGGWDTFNVVTMERTFFQAAKFEGGGLDQWITGAVTSLYGTFMGANSMNVGLGGWDVAEVTSMSQTFRDAQAFVGTGLEKWSVANVTTGTFNDMTNTFLDATSLTSCNKRKIADAWASTSTVFNDSSYATDWAADKCPLLLTDATFKQASWDWVQDTATATTKWGAIGDWNVSGVKDMSYAFTSARNEAGSYKNNGNPKAASFIGTGIDKWLTSSVTNLYYTFSDAGLADVDLGGWDTTKVTGMFKLFSDAFNFKGVGLDKWITSSLTTLAYTFQEAGSFNADVSNWDVSKVKYMQNAFQKAAKFEGDGLYKWDVTKATNVGNTFSGATSLTSCNKRKIADAWASISTVFNDSSYATDWAADRCLLPLTDATFKQASWDWVQDTTTATTKWGGIGEWDVGAVKDMSYAFSRHRNAAGSRANAGNRNASTFVGAGLEKWSTGSVTTLRYTFYGTFEFDVTLGTWDISQVTNMQETFNYAYKFKGTGLEKWNVAKVAEMSGTFASTTSLTSCNKRKIADAWASISTVFNDTSYATDWADDTCLQLCTPGSTWSASGNAPCTTCTAESTCAAGVSQSCTTTTNTTPLVPRVHTVEQH